MGDKDVWLGIDVAKGTFHAALACGEVSPRAWPKFAHAEFPHTELGMRRLLRWLGGQGVSPLGLGGVCVEATGRQLRNTSSAKRFVMFWSLLLRGNTFSWVQSPSRSVGTGPRRA